MELRGFAGRTDDVGKDALRDALTALAGAADTPVKLLVTGGIGTGKTTLLATAREALRGAGLTVQTQPPRPGVPPETALVIDDAQMLTDAELAELAERVADPRTTVVVATEPQRQHEPLRALIAAAERDRPALSLSPLALEERLLGPAETGQTPAHSLTDRLSRLDEPLLDTLLVMSLTPELGPADIAATLGATAADARRLVDRARASGLTDPSHTAPFLTLVHDAVAQLVGNAHHREVEVALLRSQLELLDMSAVSVDLALRLAEHGLRDDRLAHILADAASAADQPARLYRAAVSAGAQGLTYRLADALALSGDRDAAAALADGLLGSPDLTERAAAVRISAGIATQNGHAGQAAELFTWLGAPPNAVVGAAAAITFATTGDLATARGSLLLEDAGPPTTAARAARSLADGLLLTMDQPYPVAMSKLNQALAAEQSVGALLPDSPAALVTLAAVHAGDPVRARSVIGRALRSDGAGARSPFAQRHLLLSGWIKMQDGQLAAAGVDVAAAGSSGLQRRDALWAAALQTSIARRSGDTGALHNHWSTAMEILGEHSVDLFTLLPLGELWVAAARMRQVERLQHPLDEAFGLLESLGNPVLWAAPLHWAGVHAAILVNSPSAVAPHGQALTAAAAHSALAQTLSGAGRTWLRVLADQVDVDEVTAAARSLSHAGLTSDATRLAGQAALQTSDARVSGAMLQLARDLKVGPAPDDAPAAESGSDDRPVARQPSAGSALSDREREVAELLLLGLPYRDIGGQLFISAKTVEHHVARIRRRLGAGSRSEMLSMLRALLAPG